MIPKKALIQPKSTNGSTFSFVLSKNKIVAPEFLFLYSNNELDRFFESALWIGMMELTAGINSPRARACRVADKLGIGATL